MRKVTAGAALLLAVASLTATPAALASCPEEGCPAPSNDPESTVRCIAEYDGPLKNIGVCFLRP